MVELSARKVIVLIILIVVIVIAGISIKNNIYNFTKSNINELNQKEYKFTCDNLGRDCEKVVKDCSTDKKIEENKCNDFEIAKWKAYSTTKECGYEGDGCSDEEKTKWDEYASLYIKQDVSGETNSLSYKVCDETQCSSEDKDYAELCKKSFLSESKIKSFKESDFYKRNKDKLEDFAKEQSIDENVLYSLIINEGAYDKKTFEETVRFECSLFNRNEGILTREVPCTIENGVYSTKPKETDYNAYLVAKDRDPELAFKSSSFGFAQILGSNYVNLGLSIDYEGGLEKLKDENLQLEYFFMFLKKNNLIEPVKNKQWDIIAERYNGRQYKVHAYDCKLAYNYDILSSSSSSVS